MSPQKTHPNDLATPAHYDERTSIHSDLPLKMLCTHGGLTKREHFAAMAMQGFLASNVEKTAIGLGGIELDYMAKISVDMADELIKALNQEKP